MTNIVFFRRIVRAYSHSFGRNVEESEPVAIDGSQANLVQGDQEVQEASVVNTVDEISEIAVEGNFDGSEATSVQRNGERPEANGVGYHVDEISEESIAVEGNCEGSAVASVQRNKETSEPKNRMFSIIRNTCMVIGIVQICFIIGKIKSCFIIGKIKSCFIIGIVYLVLSLRTVKPSEVKKKQDIPVRTVKPSEVKKKQDIPVSEKVTFGTLFSRDTDLYMELSFAGWPSWLIKSAGEALNGWTPRKRESFTNLVKIGKGKHSLMYKARDISTGKFVVLRKHHFKDIHFGSRLVENDSVRSIAREIFIMRQLEHPNVVKLEGVVTSWSSSSLSLIFEYMEHDLAGLASSSGIHFTVPQVKRYMYQLLSGIEYYHNHGIFHGDINGSNLLLDNRGTLKIAGFGSASPFDSKGTLWFRSPELLLGATDYGAGADLWSAGCILVELLAGKPIMRGRTEVEQLNKIFKVCGSPPEEYWDNLRMPCATRFKPHHPYRRTLSETFKNFPPESLHLIETLLAFSPAERQTATAALQSEFFVTEHNACGPSTLPQHPSINEIGAKLQNEVTGKGFLHMSFSRSMTSMNESFAISGSQTQRHHLCGGETRSMSSSMERRSKRMF